MQWVRDRYGVPAKRGARIVYDGRPGVIVATSHGLLRIRLDGERRILSTHPCYRMTYCDVAYEGGVVRDFTPNPETFR